MDEEIIVTPEVTEEIVEVEVTPEVEEAIVVE